MSKLCLVHLSRRVVLLAATVLANGALVFADIDASQAASGGSAGLPYYGSAEFTPHWVDGNETIPDTFHRIPPFHFTNQQGEVVTEDDVDNGVYVASFFFSTCPGICPMIRSRLSMVQDHFISNEAVKILSHSIRPQTDTVSVLQAYAKTNAVVPGKWHLLTGERDAIYALARDAYFADEDLGNPDSVESFLHTENLLLIDRNRHIRGVYNGRSRSSVANLITDIETLLKEFD